LNHKEHGECFSLKGNIQNSAGGVFKSGTAYDWMLNNGYLVEAKREVDGKMKTVIYPTDGLLIKLERFFESKQ
jgi:hypothetical protein